MKWVYLFSSFFILPFNTATAETIVVTQKNLQFSHSIEVIKTNDIVTFRNEDNIIHNIVSLSKDFEFDLGIIKPRTEKSLKFKNSGVVNIECSIHPSMKLTLFVND